MNAGTVVRTGIFRLHKRAPVWTEMFVKPYQTVVCPKRFVMLSGCQSTIFIKDIMGYIEQKRQPKLRKEE